ncbi:MAG: carboxypeptidase regulatory-like domain-containing protein [Acidobacteriota bacterium]
MVSKTVKYIFALAVVTLVMSGIAVAQQGAVKGVIQGRRSVSDNYQPVEGIIVEIFRIDISQKFQTKTDKKGEYFHALPAFGEYSVSVSGEGYGPVATPKFKIVSDQPIEQNFSLEPGDGSKFTVEQVRNIVKQGPQAAPTSAADKKQAAEEQAKREEERKKIEEENTKLKKQFDDMKRHFEAGLAANQKQDYEVAITEFKQAVTIDDSQPPLFANLAQALFNLGAIRFNNKQRDQAQVLFKESADFGEKATKMDPSNATYFKIFADSCDILFKQFQLSEFADKAISAYTTGSELETDRVKKFQMINKVGSIYFNMGDVDKSMQTYDKVLAADPDNLEALSGKALVLAASGEKPKMEQAVGIFQQVIDKAPAGSRLKQEAESNSKYLVDTLKIEPPKPAKDNKKKK